MGLARLGSVVRPSATADSDGRSAKRWGGAPNCNRAARVCPKSKAKESLLLFAVVPRSVAAKNPWSKDPRPFNASVYVECDGESRRRPAVLGSSAPRFRAATVPGKAVAY